MGAFVYSGARLELRPDRERICVVLHGELDVAEVGAIGLELEQLTRAGWCEISMDLGALDFMDLAGVRLLLGAFEQSDRAGSLFTIVAASGPVCRVLELTGHAHLLEGLSSGGGEGSVSGHGNLALPLSERTSATAKVSLPE